MSLVEVDNIDCAYGRVHAVHNVSFDVKAAEIVSLIGANGAGKTTVLRAISGILRPVRGHIRYQGQCIEGKAPEEIVRLGIAHVPEGRKIFPGLTVLENLEVAAAWRHLSKADFRRELEQVFTLFPSLASLQNSRGWSLSGGEQQMLAIGRGLMANPTLLLLDEPSMGLAPNLVSQLFHKILEINRAGTAILLVEQNAALAIRISQRTYVLENGSIVLSGPSTALIRDPRLQTRYLG